VKSVILVAGLIALGGAPAELSESQDFGAEPIVVSLNDVVSDNGFVEIVNLEAQLRSSGITWVSDGPEMVLGSWSSVGEPWQSVDELSFALEAMNACLDEVVPLVAAPFAQETASSGDIPAAFFMTRYSLARRSVLFRRDSRYQRLRLAKVSSSHKTPVRALQS